MCDCRDIAAIERTQQQMIAAYLTDLWCPERPLWCHEGPPAPVTISHDRAEFRWLRQLDLEAVRTMPYADVVEAIRAA